jgi:2-oxoglutarate ferredoxin oxidoreductase subunit delta
MTGTIIIDGALCKGCALCTTACPKNVIVLSERFNAKGYHPAELRDPLGLCTGCMLCAVVCPEAAITVYRAERAAVRA